MLMIWPFDLSELCRPDVERSALELLCKSLCGPWPKSLETCSRECLKIFDVFFMLSIRLKWNNELLLTNI